MAHLFVAFSKQIAQWGSDVGLGKTLFMVATAADEAAAASFLAGKPCGADDWKKLKQQDDAPDDQEALQAKLARKEKQVDPKVYPRLRGFAGLYKVRLETVENHLLVKLALAGSPTDGVKVKPADIAAYLIHNALK